MPCRSFGRCKWPAKFRIQRREEAAWESSSGQIGKEHDDENDQYQNNRQNHYSFYGIFVAAKYYRNRADQKYPALRVLPEPPLDRNAIRIIAARARINPKTISTNPISVTDGTCKAITRQNNSRSVANFNSSRFFLNEAAAARNSL